MTLVMPGFAIRKAALVALYAGLVWAERPRILGLAHVAVAVSDVEQARAFYGGLLGFADPIIPRVCEIRGIWCSVSYG